MSEFESDLKAFTIWFVNGQRKRCSDVTADEYVRQIRRWHEWQIAGAPDARWTPTMREVRAYVAEVRERSEWAAFGMVRALKAWSRFLVADGVIETDPLADLTYLAEPSTTDTPVATLADIEAILATCGDTMVDARDRAIVCLLRCTGMRRGELILMEWADVDFGTDTVTLRATTTKGRKGRVVGFDAATRTALRQYRARLARHEDDNRRDLTSWTDRVWMAKRGVLTANGLTQAFIDRSRKAEVYVTAHSFRRSLAMRWLREGESETYLMHLAGWRSPRMVGRYVSSVVAEEALSAQRAFSASEGLPRHDVGDRRSAAVQGDHRGGAGADQRAHGPAPGGAQSARGRKGASSTHLTGR